MNAEGMDRLRVAVVARTAQDYLEALRVLHRHGEDPTKRYYCDHAENVVAQCELFFRRDCERFVDVDGEKIADILWQKSFDPSFRIKRED